MHARACQHARHFSFTQVWFMHKSCARCAPISCTIASYRHVEL